MIATLSDFMGNIWFATTLGLVGFGFGWYLKVKTCCGSKKKK